MFSRGSFQRKGSFELVVILILTVCINYDQWRVIPIFLPVNANRRAGQLVVNFIRQGVRCDAICPDSVGSAQS